MRVLKDADFCGVGIAARAALSASGRRAAGQDTEDLIERHVHCLQCAEKIADAVLSGRVKRIRGICSSICTGNGRAI